MTLRSKLALVGLGKIAREQHVPALAASRDFELVATASPHQTIAGVAGYPDLTTLLEAHPEIQAVALCTAPQIRTELATLALQKRLHVLLEKPPGTTVAEVVGLHQLAREQGCTLFASWHSRYARAVSSAEAWLAGKRVRYIRISWKEDVRVWHPGQRWLWELGGLGVFDPGINALSLLTKVLGTIIFYVAEATLFLPQNSHTPIAAQLRLSSTASVLAEVELDFLQQGPQTWDIVVDTNEGHLRLSEGGNALYIDGLQVEVAESGEYPELYAHFAQLVREHRCDVDVAPLQLVADAFLRGRHVSVVPFVE